MQYSKLRLRGRIDEAAAQKPFFLNLVDRGRERRLELGPVRVRRGRRKPETTLRRDGRRLYRIDSR